MKRVSRALVCAVVMVCAAGALDATAAEPAIGAALDERLAARVTVVWNAVPLRQALGGLLARQCVAAVIDRRIDPDQPISESAVDTPLDEVCRRLTGRLDLGVARLGDVLYIGTRASASAVRTVAALRHDEAARMPMALRAALERKVDWTWADLATPRELIERLAAEAQLVVEGIDAVPHDLWAGARMPSATWVDRLQLVLIQFDLTFAVDRSSRTLRLVPVSDDVVIERTYALGASAAEVAAQWSAKAPEATIEVRGDQVVVRARVEDHELLQPAPQSPDQTGKRRDAPPSTVEMRRYTLLSPKKPLRSLLAALERTGIDIRWDEAALQAAGASLDAIVSVSVEEATLDELLTAWLEPAGLTFRRQGNVIELLPKARSR